MSGAEGERLEDVPHRQVVFTIPKRLRIIFRYDRKLWASSNLLESQEGLTHPVPRDTEIHDLDSRLSLSHEAQGGSPHVGS